MNKWQCDVCWPTSGVSVYYSNSSIIAMITTGNGKYYSNGLQLPLRDTNIQSRLIEAAGTLLQRMATFPVPTIAAINGKPLEKTNNYYELLLTT